MLIRLRRLPTATTTEAASFLRHQFWIFHGLFLIVFNFCCEWAHNGSVLILPHWKDISQYHQKQHLWFKMLCKCGCEVNKIGIAWIQNWPQWKGNKTGLIGRPTKLAWTVWLKMVQMRPQGGTNVFEVNKKCKHVISISSPFQTRNFLYGIPCVKMHKYCHFYSDFPYSFLQYLNTFSSFTS